MGAIAEILRGYRYLKLGVIALLAIFFALALLRKPHPAKPPGVVVPLGVEQAVIVTYNGPTLVAAPYQWGVAVNVRIASVVPKGDTRVYDIRYLANRGGTFELKNYLSTVDGSPAPGFPEFTFRGDEKLSKEIEQRIRESEPVKVEVGGHYYEVLTGLGVFWIAWLLALIFWRRRPPEAAVDRRPTPLNTAAEVRAFLARLERGEPTPEAKAHLEMLLLRSWQREIELPPQPMIEALDHLRHHPHTFSAVEKLEHWLHDPSARLSPADVRHLLEPYAVERV